LDLRDPSVPDYRQWELTVGLSFSCHSGQSSAQLFRVLLQGNAVCRDHDEMPRGILTSRLPADTIFAYLSDHQRRRRIEPPQRPTG